jgi:asparagine synthase (glutamine-hydrolysing)
MCGIVGKFYFKKPVNPENNIEKMMGAIAHRGPDSFGKFLNGRVVLGFQRLSIIDTVSGHQPLYNETKKLVLVVNGEIYNYKDFIVDLEDKGHVFSTRSDCEVILHLYEEYGIEFISKLNGMFAFCLYDTINEIMFIARDRVGIKPLYYHVSDEVLIFSSEIKGILASGEIAVNANSDALSEYLCFRYLANHRTFFSKINALEPGTYLKILPTGWKCTNFWKVASSFMHCENHNLVDSVEAALISSVQRQMMTDVPLGTQLSGGVDSSLVSKLASKFSPGLKTFTVSFFEHEYDEARYAKLLADSASLEYHKILVDNNTFADNLPRVIWHHDEPLCHANSVQMFLMCKYASQHVKVLLTGEGADELFAGYPRYMICRFGEVYNRFNPALGKFIKLILRSMPTRKIAKIVGNLGLGPRELVLWNSCFASRDKVTWLMEGLDINIEGRLDLLNDLWNDELSLFDNLLLYEQKTYLQPILMRQDKMSMAASVESRVPILDNEMLDLANNMPYQFKIHNFTPKQILKKVAERHIPRRNIYKKKVGFGVPINEWLRDVQGLGRYLDLLRDMSSDLNGINKARLEKLVSEHLNNAGNHGDVLWPLINFAIWKEEFFN